MALETGTYISDLVATNPLGSDAKSSGDDHIRLVKSTIKTTFPNISGAVTPTHIEINYLSGVTSLIQPQINALSTGKGNVSGQAWTGTQDFTGSTVTVATQAPGDNSTKAASTAFVVATALSVSLPGQTGNYGLGITTDGTTPSWNLSIPDAWAILKMVGY